MKKQTIEKHEEEYYHIPKGRIRFIFLTILLLALTLGSLYITYESRTFLELGNLECTEEFCNYETYQLLILPLFILNYILISLTVCSLVSIFKKLKNYNEEGLVVGLVGGLIFGLVAGLVVGLVVGLVAGLVVGLIFGLVSGLFFGLFFGLVAGLIEEWVGKEE